MLAVWLSPVQLLVMVYRFSPGGLSRILHTVATHFSAP